jgi:hypothetical protein
MEETQVQVNNSLTDLNSKTKKRRIKKIAVAITERDLNIFRFLSSGCATFVQIQNALKTIYKMPISAGALRKRLSLLQAAGYIVSKKYYDKNKGYTLYTLEEPAIDELVRQGYAIERIRWGLPHPTFAVHELAITEIVRTIRREAAKQLYDFSIFDEKVLRKIAPDAKSYPDLIVKLVFNIAGKRIEKSLAIEYDNGTQYAIDVVQKIRNIKYPVIILSKTSDRIDVLKRVFSKADEKLNNRVFFGLLTEFYKSGLLNTEFTTASGKVGKII